MGSATSGETKTIDTTGNVNNNVVLQNPEDVIAPEILVILIIICIIKMAELIFYIFHKYRKGLKKKFTQTNIV